MDARGSPAEVWQVVELPFPGDVATRSVFYRACGARMVEAFNLPMCYDLSVLRETVADIFSVFGQVDSVELKAQRAIVTFAKDSGFDRALLGERRGHIAPPLAVCGPLGLELFESEYKRLHPPVGELRRQSAALIEEYEERVPLAARGSRPLTEGELLAVRKKWDARIRSMQKPDFYAFQQRDRPNLLTSMIDPEHGAEPRHLKRRAKSPSARPGANGGGS